MTDQFKNPFTPEPYDELRSMIPRDAPVGSRWYFSWVRPGKARRATKDEHDFVLDIKQKGEK